MKSCPACGGLFGDFLYLGLPLCMCSHPECGTAWGPGAWVARFWFNGRMAVYTGSYWRALFRYLFK